MMFRKRISWLLGGTALALLVAVPVATLAHGHDQEMARALQAAGKVLPLQDVLTRVAQTYPGQVLKVSFEEEDDYCKHRSNDQNCEAIWIYELRVLQDGGRLLKLEVDARDGKVLDVRSREPRKDHD